MESRFISELRWNSHTLTSAASWQRRMGVEPTRDRAERPLSRFEDGETHRGPYTSMFVDVFCHSHPALSSRTLPIKPTTGCAPHQPRSDPSPSIPPCVNPAGRDCLLQQCSAYQQHELPPHLPQHPQSPGSLWGQLPTL